MAKKWYYSRTAWVAILQAVTGLLSGIILVLQSGFTEESILLLSAGLKGLYDLWLRFDTKEAIEI